MGVSCSNCTALHAREITEVSFRHRPVHEKSRRERAKNAPITKLDHTTTMDNDSITFMRP